MSRIMRLSLKVVDYVSDATRRADGTVNRRVLSLLDPRVPAISSPCRGVASRDVVIDPALRLRARLFHPTAAAAAAPLPVIVFFHGGGFAFLSNASLAYDAVCRRIARYASAAVLSVDYRRSPEHRFPAPYDDGVAALRFLDDPKNHPSDVPLDASRCFLAGDSAGGNISHHVARRYAADVQTFKNVRLAGVIAVQPFFGGEERTPAELRLDGAPIVSVTRTDWMWRAFLPPGADRSHEAACCASPEAAGGVDSPAFPPVLLVIGGYDPLQDWQRRYYEMLLGSGKNVTLLEYPDGIHAFFLFPGFDDARDLMTRIAEFVAGGK
jgi:acetyl esterase/lipase